MSNTIEIMANPNSFFGTYNHFQRLGWYFDKIVQRIEELTNSECQRVMTGRFVYVEQEDAIFLRSKGTYTYVRYKAILDSNGNITHYNNISEEITTTGFKFIGYLTQHARLLLDKNGQFFDFDERNFTFPYKIADDDYVKRISAYYFPTDDNEYVFNDSQYAIVSNVKFMVKLDKVVRLRSQPDTYSSLVIEQDLLPTDHRLYPVINDEILNYPNWYQVNINNNIGFIYKKYTSQAKLKIILNNAPIRSLPLNEASVITELESSELIVYQIVNISKNLNWYKIKFEYNNQINEGWIDKTAVEVIWDDNEETE